MEGLEEEDNSPSRPNLDTYRVCSYIAALAPMLMLRSEGGDAIEERSGEHSDKLALLIDELIWKAASNPG